MIGVFGILVVAAVITMIEMPALWKNGLRKEAWSYSVLLLLGIGISIALNLHLDVPNPLDWITYLYKPISEFLHGILQ